MRHCQFTLAALLVTLAISNSAVTLAASPPGPPKFAVSERWKLGSPGRWGLLAVDSAARRLYIARSDRIDVVDADSGKLTGVVSQADGVHGVTLVPEMNRGFLSNGKTNTLTEFDLQTLKPVNQVPIQGVGPDFVLYEPFKQRVYTFNGRSASASVLDAKTLAPVGIVPFSGKPTFAASDGKGKVYVNIQDKNVMAVVDAATLQVLATWLLPSCQQPTALAFDAAHHRLFSACGNEQMVVTDSTTGKQVAKVPIGAGSEGAAFDVALSLVFVSSDDGKLTIVHEDDPAHFSVVDTVETMKSGRTMALDPKTHKVYISASEFKPAARPTHQDPHPLPTVAVKGFTVVVVAPAAAH